MNSASALPKDRLRTAALTATAMVAFAANSLLCRMALGQNLIDAASFTSVRILAGALTLGLIVATRPNQQKLVPHWKGIVSLFCYMAFFSFAYITLSAGAGALLLFGAVQLTMFVAALRGGERFSMFSWIGLSAALAGLVYLVAPGVSAPDPKGAVLMVIAGIAWGAYSLIGRRADGSLTATAANFIYSAPFAVGLSLIFIGSADLSVTGVVLAIGEGKMRRVGGGNGVISGTTVVASARSQAV